MSKPDYPNFAAFYPFYLSQHENRICRRLHFIGSTLALLFVLLALLYGGGWFWLAALVCPYALAWLGHFVYEKNRPATFRYPLLSFLGDWKMYGQMLQGKISF